MDAGAIPEDLLAYSAAGGEMNLRLARQAGRLQDAIDALNRSGPDPSLLGALPALGSQLAAYAGRNAGTDNWVGQVAKAFVAADGGGNGFEDLLPMSWEPQGPTILADPIPEHGPTILADPIPERGPTILADPIPEQGPWIETIPIPPREPTILHDATKEPRPGVPDPEDIPAGSAPQDLIDKLPPHIREGGEPARKGGGIRYPDPDRPGDQVVIEPGWSDGSGVHGGPYVKISKGGQVTRIPLAGNPLLSKP